LEQRASESRARRWIAGAVVIAAAGCATAGSRHDPRADEPGWFARRGRDLLAIFDADLSLGPGFGVRAAFTRDAQLGFMALGPWEQGASAPTWTCVAGKRGDQFGAWQIRDLEYGLSPWYRSDAALARIGREERGWQGDLAQTRETQFSVQLHVALIGIELGFDPAALGRFFAGLVGGESGPPPP
jgi:hypothetical protein